MIRDLHRMRVPIILPHFQLKGQKLFGPCWQSESCVFMWGHEQEMPISDEMEME